MSLSRSVAYDPSVAGYRATSPYEWGGLNSLYALFVMPPSTTSRWPFT